MTLRKIPVDTNKLVNQVMVEHTEMMLSGLMCSECGEVIDGEEPGYPRACTECGGDYKKDEPPHPGPYPGLVYMRVGPKNVLLEDMTRAEFKSRFGDDPSAFMDHLARLVSWHRKFLNWTGYDFDPEDISGFDE